MSHSALNDKSKRHMSKGWLF